MGIKQRLGERFSNYHGSSHAQDRGRGLRFESLENRRMLAVFTVTNLNDGPVAAAGDQPGTLRQALFDANATSESDDVVFQNGLNGTLILTEGELKITETVNVVGPGVNELTIDASGNDPSPELNEGNGSRVLNIDDGNEFVNSISVTIQDLTLTGGDVSGDGGGIQSKDHISLIRTKVTGNAASGFRAKGGGIFSFSGNLTIENSTISENAVSGTEADGGGIHRDTPTIGQYLVSITDSTISGNSASRSGGGIFTANNLVQDQAVEIINSTLSGNTAGLNGGGLFNFDGRTFISHSTITDNQAAADMGSGIASRGDDLGDDLGVTTTLHSNIVSGNIGGVDLAVVLGVVDSLVSEGYNLIGSGNSFGPMNTSSALDNFIVGGDQISVLDPKLKPLADNGGSTQTHALRATSAALDSGNPAAVIGVDGVPEFDQRGTPFGRIKDGNGDDIARMDIGAFEAPPHSADFDTDGDVDGADFLAWQLGFGTSSGASKPDGDANNDDAVDGADLDIWGNQFGTSPPTLQGILFGEPAQFGTSNEETSEPADVAALAAAWESLGSASSSTQLRQTVAGEPMTIVQLTLDQTDQSSTAVSDMSKTQHISVPAQVGARDEFLAKSAIELDLADQFFSRWAASWE